MAAPVDILIVTETAEIQRAFLDAEGFEWKTGRLDDGGRYDWFTAKVEGGLTWSAALATVATLTFNEATERLERLERSTKPRLCLLIGRAIARDSSCGYGDVAVVKVISRATLGRSFNAYEDYAPRSLWLEEVSFAAHAPDQRGDYPAPLRVVEVRHGASNQEIYDHGGRSLEIMRTSKDMFALLARTETKSRLLLCGVWQLVGRSTPASYPQVYECTPSLVAQNLVAFVLRFFPEQIRNGNFARATAPSAAPTNGAHDDDELAPLLRRAIDDVRVTSVDLSHFKNIRSLRLDFPPPHATRGHWTCIAGINGAGKSAVLQAITLALLGDRLASELGGDRLQRARRHDHDGPHDAAIELSLSAGQGTFLLRVALDEAGVADPTGDAAEMRAFWKARPKHHLLRAYGPGRNLSEYIDKRYADRSPHVQAVMTLFDPLTQVASAEALIEKAADAGFLLHLESLANHLFQDLGVVAVIDGPSLRFASQGAQLAVVDLPDGLRATLAWVADLCFAWYAAATPAEREEGLASLRATVIVDEIDLHLHPKLQRTLVERLRERLPRVQWIVTTHSPLVLASFDREEIVLLEPDPEHGVRRRELDRQITGFTLDEIVRWLMETEPHSLALDAVAEEPVDPEQRLAFLLSLSPTVGEREAREALDAVRAHRASKRPEEPSEEGT